MRIYLESFPEGKAFALSKQHAHYMTRVMRCKQGDTCQIFNAQQGEWSCHFTQCTRHDVYVCCEKVLRPALPEPPETHLFFAPLKPGPLGYLVEKATELGVTHLWPCISVRTQVRRLSTDRLTRIAIEATEQCGRFRPPIIAPLEPLFSRLNTHNLSCNTFVLSLKSTVPALSGLKTCDTSQPISFVLGPEGGWCEAEEKNFSALGLKKIHLGTYTLRAETAGVVMLALKEQQRLASNS